MIIIALTVFFRLLKTSFAHFAPPIMIFLNLLKNTVGSTFHEEIYVIIFHKEFSVTCIEIMFYDTHYPCRFSITKI